MKYFEFASDVRIVGGAGAADTLIDRILDAGGKNVFLLSDMSLEKQGLTDKVRRLAEADGRVRIGASYYNIDKNSSLGNLSEIYEIYRENGCDCILAYGNKYVTDIAKCLSLMLSSKTRDLLSCRGINCVKAIERVPFVCLLSSLGGTEVTNVAVLRDDDKKELMYFISDEMKPDVCIADSALISAGSAEEAVASLSVILVNAVESLISAQSNLISDNFAKAALALLAGAFRKLREDPAAETRAEVREDICRASLLAGMACANSATGLTRAIANAIYGVTGIEPDAALGVVVMPVLYFSRERCKDKLSQLYFYLGGEQAFAAVPPEKRAEMFLETVYGIIRHRQEKFGVPATLRELGVSEDAFEEIAERSRHEISALTSAKSAEKEDILKLLRMCQ